MGSRLGVLSQVAQHRTRCWWCWWLPCMHDHDALVSMVSNMNHESVYIRNHCQIHSIIRGGGFNLWHPPGWMTHPPHKEVWVQQRSHWCYHQCFALLQVLGFSLLLLPQPPLPRWGMGSPAATGFTSHKGLKGVMRVWVQRHTCGWKVGGVHAWP